MQWKPEMIALFMCCLRFSKVILLRWHISYFTISYNRTFDPASAAKDANRILFNVSPFQKLVPMHASFSWFKEPGQDNVNLHNRKSESRSSLRNDWVSTSAAVASQPAWLWRRKACHERGLFNHTSYLSFFLHNFWFNFSLHKPSLPWKRSLQLVFL